MKKLFNAESNESTLRSLVCNKVDNTQRNKPEKKRNFPSLTFGKLIKNIS